MAVRAEPEPKPSRAGWLAELRRSQAEPRRAVVTPGYIAFISGSTFNELLEKKINLTPIIYFTLGF